MAAGDVKSFEKESFKRQLAQLAARAEIADADFAEAVYEAVARFGISENEFRAEFGVTGGAVERWTMQKNLPQLTVRAKILHWIAAQVG